MHIHKQCVRSGDKRLRETHLIKPNPHLHQPKHGTDCNWKNPNVGVEGELKWHDLAWRRALLHATKRIPELHREVMLVFQLKNTAACK